MIYKFILLISLVLIVMGCCGLSKRSCFPTCPPKRIITIEKECELPMKIVMAPIEMSEVNCPEENVCFDLKNYSLLTKRLNEMRLWIEIVRTRCGVVVR